MRNILLAIGAIILLIVVITLIYINVDMEVVMDTSNKESGINNETKGYKNICNHNNTVFCSHLPIVLIEADDQRIYKEEKIWVEIKVIDNKNGNNHLEDEPDFTTVSTIKYRGNTSYTTSDKKQYRLEFFKEKEGKKRNISVMGMKSDCDWVLNAPFLDRSLLRNNLIYGISRGIMDWAPATEFCEVFLDGEYQGVYLMIESIKISKSRINLNNFGLISGETPYLVKRERRGTELNAINTYGAYTGKTGHELSISYPQHERITEAQREWIRNDINRFERALYSDFFHDEEKGYRAYIDVDSFVDYYIINEFFMNIDAGYLSTYTYKDINGRLKMVVWDFNNALNNYAFDIQQTDQFYIYNNWFKRLLEDKNFVENVIKRYYELRKGALEEEYLLNSIDKSVAYLGSAIDRNFQLWGYTFFESLLSKNEDGSYRDPSSYEEAVEQIKKCIIERGRFLDKNIEKLYIYNKNDLN